MKIVVCLKPVRSELVYKKDEGYEEFVLNPYDLYVIKQCIELKKTCDCEIICLAMGVKSSEEILLKVKALGMDEVILLSDSRFGGSDTVATTYILSKAIEKIGDVDVVLCGKSSVDGETGQVGFGISEQLNYYVTDKVSKINGFQDGKANVVEEDEN